MKVKKEKKRRNVEKRMERMRKYRRRKEWRKIAFGESRSTRATKGLGTYNVKSRINIFPNSKRNT